MATRWDEIKSIFHAAAERPPSERAAFLAQACANDHELQHEVERLLSSDGQAAAFLESPAAGLTSLRVGIGTTLGPYEIQSLLGVGGMGEVYRARDTTLGRDVAIKVLPAMVSLDSERLARFEREARVLAALNHPHIGAIYGIEEVAGVRGLVLELVEGHTLADRLAQVSTGARRSGVSVSEAVTIARQIAEALDAAHEKGIIHRDLKPANIKITPDGVVKVLDFGLAKVMVDDASGRDLTQSPTVTVHGTRDGVLLGTVAYMSPEQARGKPLDKRTDIWAFGCVFYELLTGRPAFPGETVSDTIAAILQHDPDWTALPAATPPGIRRLLQRCLEKDPRRRLRDIGDVRIELDDTLSATASTASAVVESRRRLPAVRSAALLVGGIGAAVAVGWTLRPGPQTSAAPVFSRAVRLTSGPAQEFGPAISPDGKWVAYLSNTGGPTDVWVKFIAGGDPANLTASAGLDITSGTGISGLEMSPDGTRIAVMARPRGSSTPFETWEISAPLPGVPRKLLDGGVGLRWSPDGRQMTFIRAGGAAGDALFVADADGTNRREIIKVHDAVHIHWPAWARDGYIYFIRIASTTTTTRNAEPAEIYRITARGGTMEPVVSTSRRAVFPLPMPDGTGLIYAANPTTADLSLWWRPANGGEARRLTTGIGEYAEPRIAMDGRTLVCTLYELRQSLSRIPVTGGSAAQMSPITNGYDGDLDPTLAPEEDRLVFSSSRSGNRHLWSAHPDGSDARPLTSGTSLDERPVISPDGKQIAFVSDRSSRHAIWMIGRDGGAPRKLADAATPGGLSWSPDGRQIVYAAGTGDGPGLWTVFVADGHITRLSTPGLAAEPAWSPARNLIAYMSPSRSGPALTKLAFVDAAGQPMYTALPRPPETAGFSNGKPAWAPDGRRLAVVSQASNTAASIWIVDPDAAEPYRKLIDLGPGPRVRGITWTRDGSALIIGKDETSSDIILLDQAK